MRFTSEQHLDTLAVTSGLLERTGTGDCASDVTSVFVDIARDHACRSIRAALGLEGTRSAIAGAGDISKLVLGKNASGRLQKACLSGRRRRVINAYGFEPMTHIGT